MYPCVMISFMPPPSDRTVNLPKPPFSHSSTGYVEPHEPAVGTLVRSVAREGARRRRLRARAIPTCQGATCNGATGFRRITLHEGLLPRGVEQGRDQLAHGGEGALDCHPSPPQGRALRAYGPQGALEGWEAVPIAAPLAHAAEASSIRRAWSPIRVPGHWQLEDAFGPYEGLVLYRCRFAWRPPAPNEMVTLRFGGVYYSARVWLNGSYLGDHRGYFGTFEFD